MIINNAYSIVPAVNLVSNIGVSGHHNKGKKPSKNNNLSTPKTDEFAIETYIEEVEPSLYDEYHFHHHYWLRRVTQTKKIKRKLKKIITKLFIKT